MTKSTSKPVSCDGCRKHFPSKNKLFQHLALNSDGCLSPEEYAEYLRNPRNHEKICVLYGYLPGTDYQRQSVPDGACGIESGQHASWLLTQAIDRVCRGINNKTDDEVDVSWSAEKADTFKINRSYGTLSRNTDAAHQDEYTGAVTEMLCTNTSPLFFDFTDNDDSTKEEDDDATKERRKKKVTLWVQAVNQELDHLLSRFTQQNKMKDWSPGRIRVFGRLSMPQKKFNPETDVVHRRVDYCFPADLLYVSNQDNDDNTTMSESAVQLQVETMQHFFDKMVSFPPGNKPARVFDAGTAADRKKEDDYVEAPVDRDRDKYRPAIRRPDDVTLTYLYNMKKVMQAFTTQVEDVDQNDSGAMLEKKFSESKRIKQKQHNSSKQDKRKQKEPQKKKHRKQKQDEGKKETNDSTILPAKRFLRRKRFHNFSPNVLAHDFLAYRRLDRIYHRGTIRLDSTTQDGSKSEEHTSRPFVVFSLTGDLFLHQQARRVIGLLIAILRGCIDIDILDLVFDENYAHLVSAPLAPSVGLMQGEATYMTYEGRLSMVLSARRTNAFSKGFNDEDVVTSVEQWEASVLKDIAKAWSLDGTAANVHINTVPHWLETVLNPWAAKARIELEHYRRWKAGEIASSLPPVDTIDSSVPHAYAKCLQLLREVDASGAWPDTSAQRQLVMLSTPNDESQQTKNLTAARMAAKTNNSESRSCAYSFKEGQGGASGSFSVGIMPDRSSQPKGNLQFPHLVKTAFELERALFPDREPSSTIAINRNGQFRPHKDKGAGAGQSTSLIVAMGNFVGGELMVEGSKKDIRYNAIEFDGWNQRHWTLPFKGERYSLVWFTPKGCEGMRGIDLDFDSLCKEK